ncbi:hypothetical protein [Streptomyces diastatochromogenes]|uniref:hypothetical protein n=1 Tax=Streptomyces diastatochromogenes TaxID=42236 RepID=UPI0036BB2F6F
MDRALPPGWVPRPARGQHIGLGLLAAGLETGVLTWPGDWPGWLAALLGLHLLWSVMSPEIVRVVAPVSAVAVLLWPPASSWPQAVAGVLALAVLWTAALLRLAARARQRERAADVSGGATAPVPDAGPAVVRGRFQAGCGGFFVAVAVAVVLLVAPGGPHVPPVSPCEGLCPGTAKGCPRLPGHPSGPVTQMPAAADRSRLMAVSRSVARAWAAGRSAWAATGTTTSR